MGCCIQRSGRERRSVSGPLIMTKEVASILKNRCDCLENAVTGSVSYRRFWSLEKRARPFLWIEGECVGGVERGTGAIILHTETKY